MVANSGDDDAGHVGERLRQRGFELAVFHRDGEATSTSTASTSSCCSARSGRSTGSGSQPRRPRVRRRPSRCRRRPPPARYLLRRAADVARPRRLGGACAPHRDRLVRRAVRGRRAGAPWPVVRVPRRQVHPARPGPRSSPRPTRARRRTGSDGCWRCSSTRRCRPRSSADGGAKPPRMPRRTESTSRRSTARASSSPSRTVGAATPWSTPSSSEWPSPKACRRAPE